MNLPLNSSSSSGANLRSCLERDASPELTINTTHLCQVAGSNPACSSFRSETWFLPNSLPSKHANSKCVVQSNLSQRQMTVEFGTFVGKRQTSAAFHWFLLFIIMMASQFGGAWNEERIESWFVERASSRVSAQWLDCYRVLSPELNTYQVLLLLEAAACGLLCLDLRR